MYLSMGSQMSLKEWMDNQEKLQQVIIPCMHIYKHANLDNALGAIERTYAYDSWSTKFKWAKSKEGRMEKS
jgi:hypothetical protein